MSQPVCLVMSSSYIGFWFRLPAEMDPKQPVVLQLLESLKDSYMSNDFKTCQQLLGQLKVGLIHSHFRSSDTNLLLLFLQDIVDQKASS